MKKSFFGYLIFFIALNLFAQKSEMVSVLKNESGMKLMVNEKPFMIYGMNWDYFPIGKNYEFNLWNNQKNL